MEKQYSERRLPSNLISSSTVFKLMLVGLMLCLILIVPYTYIPFLNEESRSEPVQQETTYYGKDNGCNNIKTAYKMHKLLKENGQKLAAKQRAQLVTERCRTFVKENSINLNLSARCKFDKEAFMISRSYDLCICYHCKVASTNTKRVLYGLDHNFNLTNDINNITVLQVGMYINSRKINFHRLISKKRKVHFMFVREPLERLLSAYLDQRGFPTEYFNNSSFSFEKFLNRILDRPIPRLDRHLYPYFERCRPCEIQFDYIGLQSSFNDDIKILLEQIHASDKIAIPSRQKTGYNTSMAGEKFLKQYFAKVPNDLIHKIWAKYYKDYYIFGFPYPSHLMN